MDLVEKFLGALVVIIVALMITLLAQSYHASRICLENGYPDAQVLLISEPYCVRIINQTEYVCALSDVVAGTCPEQGN